jgi:transcriptional regulator with XRE-family HTH domain
MTDFGDELERILAERGISLRQAARNSGCSPGYLCNVARGRKPLTPSLADQLDRGLGTGDTFKACALSPASDWRTALETGPARAARPATKTGEFVTAIAGESSDRAFSEAARTVPDLGVVQLAAELQRIARLRPVISPLDSLVMARKLRDESSRLSERTRRPAQLADLHVITGAACGLLAMASWDLGAWLAAAEQAHAAGIYGEIAGHRGLQAWAAGSEGLIAFWRGRPRDAVDVIGRGLSLAPPGTARARLHCIAARAMACLGEGEADRVRLALGAADRERDNAGGTFAEELHDEIGGEYSWDAARHAMCAATALLISGDADSAAARAREAITLHAQGSESGGLVSAKARADLACAELAGGRLDAAQDALDPVWAVAPGFRSYPLIGRLGRTSAALAGQQYARARPAAELVEQIRVFSAESAPALAERSGVLTPGSQ